MKVYVPKVDMSYTGLSNFVNLELWAWPKESSGLPDSSHKLFINKCCSFCYWHQQHHQHEFTKQPHAWTHQTCYVYCCWANERFWRKLRHECCWNSMNIYFISWWKKRNERRCATEVLAFCIFDTFVFSPTNLICF